MQKFRIPCTGGFQKYFFRKLLFYFVVSNPFHILEVWKKIKSKFSNLSPIPTPGVLNFHFGIGVRPKGPPQIGLKEWSGTKNRGLKN